MEACEGCEMATGTILFKKEGRANAPEYTGPRFIVVKDSLCEFCEFLNMWMHSEEIDPKETGLKYGAAKIVERDPKSGVDTLVAYVPFSSEDEITKHLSDGTEFDFEHGLLLRAEKADQGMNLVEILK